ncbi:MAG: hypothetical protein U5L75_02450 [Candidatus Campbellbacteria bacterium]|nr:hypothetical protein [Candidatus Campbellbacteria bacterium]
MDTKATDLDFELVLMEMSGQTQVSPETARFIKRRGGEEEARRELRGVVSAIESRFDKLTCPNTLRSSNSGFGYGAASSKNTGKRII